MVGTDELWLAVRWLHLVAMAFFVGGQMVLAAAVMPAERRASDPQRLRTIARRFAYGSLLALGVLLATGALLAGHFGRWSDPTLHLKLALVAVTGVVVGLHMRRPRMHALTGGTFLLSLVIVWLGLALAHGG
jgi:uncharacterized membrane protein